MSVASKIPVLTTRRLRLTIPGARAATEMLRYMRENRDHLAPWMAPPDPRADGEPYWRLQLTQDLAEWHNGRGVRFLVFESGRMVGMCSFTQISGGTCNLGYSIDHRLEGQGLMAEAVRAGLRFMFEEKGMRQVHASYMPSNERSGALLGRLGFRIEGTSRDAVYFNGRWQDLVRTVLQSPGPPGRVGPRS